MFIVTVSDLGGNFIVSHHSIIASGYIQFDRCDQVCPEKMQISRYRILFHGMQLVIISEATGPGSIVIPMKHCS